MISSGIPKAKAFLWGGPDAEGRKRGEQKGLVLDTHRGMIKELVPHFRRNEKNLAISVKNHFIWTIPREV